MAPCANLFPSGERNDLGLGSLVIVLNGLGGPGKGLEEWAGKYRPSDLKGRIGNVEHAVSELEGHGPLADNDGVGKQTDWHTQLTEFGAIRQPNRITDSGLKPSLTQIKFTRGTPLSAPESPRSAAPPFPSSP